MNLTESQAEVLLHDAQEFDRYLESVRERRERHRRQLFWSHAVQRLEAELSAASEENHLALVSEISFVLTRFQEALAACNAPSVPQTEAGMSQAEADLEDLMPTTGEEPGLDEEPGLPEGLQPASLQGAAPEIAAPEIAAADREAREREEMRLAAEEEGRLAARLAHLRSEGDDYYHDGADTLACRFRARSLYADTLASLEQAGILAEKHAAAAGIALGLKEVAEMLVSSAPVRDQWEFPFVWRTPRGTGESIPWGQLAAAYRHCADAADILSWYVSYWKHLTRDERTCLMDAILAAHRGANRLRDISGHRDNALGEFLRMALEAKSSDDFGWLNALDKRCSEQRVLEIASQGRGVWQEVQEDVEARAEEEAAEEAEEQARQARHQRQQDAISGVEAWEDTLEGSGMKSEDVDRHREALLALLEECLQAKVPPTNVRVRKAILDTAPILLENEPKYAKFLDAVLTERSRLELAEVSLDEAVEVPDVDFAPMLKTVRDYMSGKKVMILGGRNRPNVVQELSASLNCDVSWPTTEPNDKKDKHDAVILRADIILLAKDYARHNLLQRGKQAVKTQGSALIPLSGGYNMRQVVFQVNEYLLRGQNGRTEVS